ncbi:hypothetical protein SKAU_G00016000 [Synaphobranchus kaupii]|uniref:Uncharacterized protein n=1 Tax=Synaphobranchus kaupii TaxID=118154 RepID=A0A9Q1GCQ2_SYNKA|nr:hypothetical protein SKAU_G00016000 [Synaphobranchus kaupii]
MLPSLPMSISYQPASPIAAHNCAHILGLKSHTANQVRPDPQSNESDPCVTSFTCQRDRKRHGRRRASVHRARPGSGGGRYQETSDRGIFLSQPSSSLRAVLGNLVYLSHSFQLRKLSLWRYTGNGFYCIGEMGHARDSQA